MTSLPAESAPPRSTATTQRWDGVDVLRGLSILAVVLLHILIRFSFIGVRLGRDWPKLLRHFVFFNGGNGVTIFFAVSGFLITLTSIRRFGSLRALRPAIFYRIRFARIMPLLLLLLAVLSVLHLAHVDAFRIDAHFFSLPRALFAALSFHLNWLETARDHYLPACWTVLWSLSIEEMFYLFFPLVCVVLLRRRGGLALWCALALAFVAMGPFARTAWAHTGLAQENSYLAGIATIALGCVTAVITDRFAMLTLQPKVRSRVLFSALVLGWANILLITIWPRWRIMRPLGASGLDDTLLAFGTCLVLFATTLRNARGTRWSAPIRWFGRHSYEVYLSHEFIVIGGVALFARRYPTGTARPIVATFVVAMLLATAPLGWLLARYFSDPLNRRLRRAA